MSNNFFGEYGSEKMIYDIRMGPQCLFHDGEFFAVYQANIAGGRALPHIVKRGRDGKWSAPVIPGDVSNYDHHFAPVLWIDRTRHIHVLYHCHIYLNESRHLVSRLPLDISGWQDAPCAAPSISYPAILNLPDGKLLLYYRALGHMGYWTWQISGDGGFTWKRRDVPLVDFDRDPEVPGDDWAGSYHSVTLGRGGRSLHIAFVYWDERNWPHPLYKTVVGHRNRFHLYYLKADIESGELFTVSGERMECPVNKKAAEKCLVWDTGSFLTNMPSILVDENDCAAFLMPVSGRTLQDCTFWFIRRENGAWHRYPVTKATSTWNGSHMEYGDHGEIVAYLSGQAPQPENLPYGGGPLQEMVSGDGGKTWSLRAGIVPADGILCNNPRPVTDAAGVPVKRTLLFYGWPGPDGISPEGAFRGKCWLWQNRQWL